MRALSADHDREVPHPTPSSTWRCRSSRAIAAYSSDVWAALHASIDLAGCSVPHAQLDVDATVERLREPERRDRRGPLEREHVRLGSAATRSAASSARTSASCANVASW